MLSIKRSDVNDFFLHFWTLSMRLPKVQFYQFYMKRFDFKKTVGFNTFKQSRTQSFFRINWLFINNQDQV